MEAPLQYDKFGRMLYHPDYHQNNGKKWTVEELEYLIEWYYIIGPEEMSFALERTIATVSHKAYQLVKQGLIVKPNEITHHKRIKKSK